MIIKPDLKGVSVSNTSCWAANVLSEVDEWLSGDA